MLPNMSKAVGFTGRCATSFEKVEVAFTKLIERDHLISGIRVDTLQEELRLLRMLRMIRMIADPNETESSSCKSLAHIALSSRSEHDWFPP